MCDIYPDENVDAKNKKRDNRLQKKRLKYNTKKYKWLIVCWSDLLESGNAIKG